MATSSGRSEQLNTPPNTEEFADKVFTAALGTMETFNLYLGERLGWLDALAEAPATPAELAERTGTNTRYAVEWLEAQAVYGNLTVVDDGAGDRLQRRYAMPPGAAEVLTDRHSLNYLGALPQMMAAAGAQLEKLLEAYRDGGGVSWAELGDNARDSQAALNRPWFESALAPALASVPEIRGCARSGRAPGLPISVAVRDGRPSRWPAPTHRRTCSESISMNPRSRRQTRTLKRPALLIGRVSSSRQAKHCPSLAPLMLPSRSNAFTTCRARLTYWRRYTERSVPTDWW